MHCMTTSALTVQEICQFDYIVLDSFQLYECERMVNTSWVWNVIIVNLFGTAPHYLSQLSMRFHEAKVTGQLLSVWAHIIIVLGRQWIAQLKMSNTLAEGGKELVKNQYNTKCVYIDVGSRAIESGECWQTWWGGGGGLLNWEYKDGYM